MNTSLKIITKGMNNRLAPMAIHIIDKTQTSFMQNMFIMEGLCVFHEVLNEVKRKNLYSVLLRLILIAYGNVNLDLFYNVMLN
jgi:hypothetical protein